MTDAENVLQRVRTLIASGRHLDEVPGLPGVELDGGGMFRGNRRIYTRGTEEYASAESRGLLDQLAAPPRPATESALVDAESRLGARLPALLRDLYAVANGGFGPGYGLLGLHDGFTDDLNRNAIDILDEAAKGRWPGMPDGLLPLCHWGCAIYSFVHCPTGRVYAWDPNPVEPDDDVPFFEQEYEFEDWITSWLDGSLQQPWLVVDPTTGVYRGATIDETRAALEDGE